MIDVEQRALRTFEHHALPRRHFLVQKQRDIGQAAAQHVRTNFCEGAVVPQYEALYREVLER